MSARDDLEKAFVDAMQDANWHRTAGEDYEKSTALIDAYAHELAEKIREDARLGSRLYADAKHDAADLIDPEVRKRVRPRAGAGRKDSGMDETGWYAEEDTDAPVAGSPWRAILQLPGFVVPTEGHWFETEAACLEFIRDDILGKGLFPARPGLRSP